MVRTVSRVVSSSSSSRRMLAGVVRFSGIVRVGPDVDCSGLVEVGTEAVRAGQSGHCYWDSPNLMVIDGAKCSFRCSSIVAAQGRLVRSVVGWERNCSAAAVLAHDSEHRFQYSHLLVGLQRATHSQLRDHNKATTHAASCLCTVKSQN